MLTLFLTISVHGGWEPWESWISCTRTCGGGVSLRERSCDAPTPAHGGRFCTGGVLANIDANGIEWDSRPCNTQTCTGVWNHDLRASLCSNILIQRD